jgi:hypothetical protein
MEETIHGLGNRNPEAPLNSTMDGSSEKDNSRDHLIVFMDETCHAKFTFQAPLRQNSLPAEGGNAKK